MISCVIIDDEQPAINVLKHYVSKTPEICLTATYTDPVNAVKDLENTFVHLIFLDIQMNKLSGVEVIKKLHPESNVVFCTAYSEFAVAGYELEAFDYLLKPVSFSRFEKTIQKLKRKLYPENQPPHEYSISEDYIFVKTEHKGKMKKIELSELVFIEAKGNYVLFQTLDEKIISLTTMKDLEDRLPSSHFMRVHKSYIVSLSRITTVENGMLLLKTGEAIPLSLTYREGFFNTMKEKIITR
jgi:DNA-binding LytR/AlgR family response regulator